MKFTYYLEKIQDVAKYPIFSLILFIVMFLLALIWTYRTDSKTIEHIENLPLEDEDNDVNKS